MGFLTNLFYGGSNITRSSGFGSWLGRRLALRHKNVKIGKDTGISPEAMICPREGFIEIGSQCAVNSNAAIQGNVRIGDRSRVQMNTMIVGYGPAGDPSGQVTIGNDVLIAPNCMILAGNHGFADPEKPINQQPIVRKPIVIEDNVWIAGRCNITAGVTIGHGSVIGAGSVVTKDIPPMSVAAGVPAKVIKRRTKE